MSLPDSELDGLFHDMATQSVAPEPVADQVQRRQRAIGGMRASHQRVLDERGRLRRRRVWIWGVAAASFVLCGSALAGAGGLLPFFRAPRPPQPPMTATPHALGGPGAAHGQPTAPLLSVVAPSPAPVPADVTVPSRSVAKLVPSKERAGDL